jgi:N-acyl homoserine lactone hydrolase
MRVATFACAFTALLGAAAGAHAQDMKLWQITSGTLTLDKSLLTSGRDVGKAVTIPVAMYVIQHPRGLVVFDTGNNVAVSGDGCVGYWGQGVCKAVAPKQAREEVIDQQLEKLGFKLDDVKYVIYSHMHVDHAGNLEMFKNAVNVIQRDELRFAWWPEKFYAGFYNIKDYEKTRDYKFMELSGDFDLFGDGRIVILSTPGHTAGHQSLKVRLPKTGTLVLTGDAIYTPENEAGVPAGIAYQTATSMQSVERLKMFRDAEAGQLWFSHFMPQFEEHRHAKDKPYE